MIQMDNKMKGFVLRTNDSLGAVIKLEIAQDHHAEQVLRGLVHSGFIVTIQETMIDTPEYIKVQRAQEEADYNRRERFDEPTRPTSGVEAAVRNY